MKASELRIGNWYKNMSNDNPFNQIKYGHEIDYVAIYCKPIPLTEEWLLKFGFTEKYKSTSNRWTKWSENGIFELHDCEDEEGEIHGVFLYDFKMEIQHIHQLQNLYFALTGEEL